MEYLNSIEKNWYLFQFALAVKKGKKESLEGYIKNFL